MNTNVAIISGHLVRDPELRYTDSGKAHCRFTLAVNRLGKTDDGRSEADFIPVVVWEKPAEATATYLTKGSQAIVTGRISVRNYQDKEGMKRYITEIVASRIEFVGGKNGNGNGSKPSLPPQVEMTDDDEIPF